MTTDRPPASGEPSTEPCPEEGCGGTNVYHFKEDGEIGIDHRPPASGEPSPGRVGDANYEDPRIVEAVLAHNARVLGINIEEPSTEAALVLEGMRHLQRERGRLSKVSVEDVAALLDFTRSIEARATPPSLDVLTAILADSIPGKNGVIAPRMLAEHILARLTEQNHD